MHKKQIGLCFTFENQEWIYEGGFQIEKGDNSYNCNHCNKQLKGKYHLFNSSHGYNNGTYESRLFGGECVKKIIQAGFKKN